MTKQVVDPNYGCVHNAWLDWLRFLAALEVVLTHARASLFVEYAKLHPDDHTVPVQIWTGLTRLGYEAVIVFFVLSGFLVGGRALDLARAGRFDPARYLVDRIVRIQLPLTGAVLFSAVVAWWLTGQVPFAVAAGNLFSLQGVLVPVMTLNHPLWSLSYEVWFYVVGGAFAFLLSARRFNIIGAALIVVAAAIFTRLNILYLGLWVGGAIAYQFKPARPIWSRVAIGTIIVGAGVIVYQLSKPRSGFADGYPAGLLAGGVVMLAGLALVIPNLYVSRWTSGPMARAGTFLASFSYSLYLTHGPLLVLSPIQDRRQIGLEGAALYVAEVLGCLIFAFLFSRIFETTGPSIKRWIARTVERADARHKPA